MLDKHRLRLMYHTQGAHAARRGIDFELTFPDWLDLWVQSGRLHLRGCRKGGYVMARKNDEGPYAIGNVYIESLEVNSSDGSKKRVVTTETREKLRLAATGKRASVATREKQSLARRGRPTHKKGWRHSEASRLKMSASHKGRPPWNKGMRGKNKGELLLYQSRKKIIAALITAKT